MGMIGLLASPIRSIVRFPLFQLTIVVVVILFLQAADDQSLFGQIYYGLDKMVEATVALVSAAFSLKSFTKSWLAMVLSYLVDLRFAQVGREPHHPS